MANADGNGAPGEAEAANRDSGKRAIDWIPKNLGGRPDPWKRGFNRGIPSQTVANKSISARAVPTGVIREVDPTPRREELRACVEVEFYHRVGGDALMVIDRRDFDNAVGNEVERRLREERTSAIHEEVNAATALGLQSVSLSGTEAFRREAWLVAESYGVRAEGYSPSETDHVEAIAVRWQSLMSTGTRNDELTREGIANLVASDIASLAQITDPDMRADGLMKIGACAKAYSAYEAELSARDRRLAQEANGVHVPRTCSALESNTFSETADWIEKRPKAVLVAAEEGENHHYQGRIVSITDAYVVQSIESAHQDPCGVHVRHERSALHACRAELLSVGSIVQIRYPLRHIGFLSEWGCKELNGAVSTGVEPKGFGK